MSTILAHVTLCVNLECRSQMFCARLDGNRPHYRTQKIAICAPLHNFVGGAILLIIELGPSIKDEDEDIPVSS